MCVPSTESLENAMPATCGIQLFGGKWHAKPDNIEASMYVAMVDLPAVEQLPVMTFSAKSLVTAVVQSQIVAVVPPRKALPHGRLVGPWPSYLGKC